MDRWPKNLAEAKAYRYGAWAGMPKGVAYRVGECAAEVWDSGRGARHHQCGRKSGHGPDGIFCPSHDPTRIKKREDAREAKWKAKNDEESAIQAEAEALSVRLGVKGVADFLWISAPGAVKYGRRLVISFDDAARLADRLGT